MRRKILMGVLALALPAGTLAITSSAAFAKKAPPNPITCSGLSGTVNFGVGLSTNGQTTPVKKGGNNTTVTGGSFSCTGGVTGSVPTLTIPNGKNTKISKGVYSEGTWAAFISAGGSLKKDLKTIAFTIGGGTNNWKSKGSAEIVGAPCGTSPVSEVGFQISGQVKGQYDTKTATILACLGTDTGPNTSGSFGTDFGASGLTVLTSGLDPVTSNATL